MTKTWIKIRAWGSWLNPLLLLGYIKITLMLWHGIWLSTHLLPQHAPALGAAYLDKKLYDISLAHWDFKSIWWARDGDFTMHHSLWRVALNYEPEDQCYTFKGELEPSPFFWPNRAIQITCFHVPNESVTLIRSDLTEALLGHVSGPDVLFSLTARKGWTEEEQLNHPFSKTLTPKDSAPAKFWVPMSMFILVFSIFP